MKSKLFPQCKQRIHPVLLLFFNRMILNSGRHTQPDPQSCRVGSPERRRGEPKNKQRIKRPKQKLSSATPNHDKKASRQQWRNQHLTYAMLRKPATTTPKQFQTTWCFGKTGDTQAELETFNHEPCSLESCHSETFAKVLLFSKAAPIFAKKVTAAISFSGP